MSANNTSQNPSMTDLNVAMPLEIEFSKAADVASSINMDREFTEEVDDGRCTRRKRKPEDKWSQDYGQQFFNEDQNLHLEQLTELFVDLFIAQE